MFSSADLEQIESKGISLEVLNEQINNFKTGFPFMNIVKAATINDGIIRLSDEQLGDLVDFYETSRPNLDIMKFVPASGAATRMFKALFEYMEVAKTTSPSQSNKSIKEFFGNLENFAFYDSLKNLLPANADDYTILETLLTDKGLNYGALPKGLLEFHRYEAATRTAAEEQMADGIAYASSNSRVRLHFTVSPEHLSKFKEVTEQAAEILKDLTGCLFMIDFSVQKPSTDTIAVDANNEPFRASNGTLLFRPAGHGALLDNLDDLSADLIFIKNIDNVVPEHHKPIMIQYKKGLAGLLLRLQKSIFDFQQRLDEQPNENLLTEIEIFFNKEFNITTGILNVNEAKKIAFKPLRVCGMVQNVGEPGGGPFWIEENGGGLSLQIVESAQINLENQKSKDIFASSTHFNPVDLVCSTKNYKGENFNLPNYRDSKTGFITIKSQGGRELKAQELPGLWNGSMSNWNTVFVEVPLNTFNPVKTVNDLLRPQHQ